MMIRTSIITEFFVYFALFYLIQILYKKQTIGGLFFVLKAVSFLRLTLYFLALHCLAPPLFLRLLWQPLLSRVFCLRRLSLAFAV